MLVGEGNALLAAGEVGREGAARLRAALESMDAVLGVLLPARRGPTQPPSSRRCSTSVRRRGRSRDFKRADEARAPLEGLGVVLEDGPKGTRWRRKR